MKHVSSQGIQKPRSNPSGDPSPLSHLATLSEASSVLLQRKIPTGTKIVLQVFVSVDPGMPQNELALQKLGEVVQRIQLLRRWFGHLKIPNQADPNGSLIQALASHVAAVNLFFPTSPNLNFTITSLIGAIPNHKMIGQTILHPSAQVSLVKDFGIAVAGRRVMHNDLLPPLPVHMLVPDLPAQFSGNAGSAAGGLGNFKMLSRTNHVRRRKPVQLLKLFNRRTKLSGDLGKRIALLHEIAALSGNDDGIRPTVHGKTTHGRPEDPTKLTTIELHTAKRPNLEPKPRLK